MRMSSPLLITVATLSLAACGPLDEGGLAAVESSTQALNGVTGSFIGNYLALYDGTDGYQSLGNFRQDVPDLAALGATDLAESLANLGTTIVTVYAAPNYLGRCQTIMPGMTLNELKSQAIGPNRISSLRFGVSCPYITASVKVKNDVGTKLRVRINQNNLWSDDWTYFGSGSTATLPVSAHTWKYAVDVYEALYGWDGLSVTGWTAFDTVTLYTVDSYNAGLNIRCRREGGNNVCN